MKTNKIVVVDQNLGMIGKNIKFKNEPFFNLQVGSFINQIGDGRRTGVIRTDIFYNPVKYVGSILCDFSYTEKFYAFDTGVISNENNVYLLYGSTGDEIYTEAKTSKKGKDSYLRFYKPIFIEE